MNAGTSPRTYRNSKRRGQSRKVLSWETLVNSVPCCATGRLPILALLTCLPLVLLRVAVAEVRGKLADQPAGRLAGEELRLHALTRLDRLPPLRLVKAGLAGKGPERRELLAGEPVPVRLGGDGPHGWRLLDLGRLGRLRRRRPNLL